MVTFDSPIERCTICGEVVLMDQMQKECASEHGCGDRECPLGKYFEGTRFDNRQHPEPSATSERSTTR